MPLQHRAGATYDQGSFRDRGSRVYLLDGEVYRALDASAKGELEAALAAPFFRRAIAAGQIVGTEWIEAGPASLAPPGPWVASVRHERIPLVSYPYEWTFGMLRDAAQLQLELLDAALAEGFILKDASAYNIQWRGGTPVFIDVGSFVRYQAGSPWPGYRQFCQHYLYPLMLQAYKGAPFHPWLRGRIDGIPPVDFASLLCLRDLLRPGVLAHAWLHAKASGRPGVAGATGPLFTPDMIRTNVQALLRLVRRLDWSPSGSVWSDYTTSNSYGEGDRATKEAFVAAVSRARRRRQVWDLGSNTGTFARLAARDADLVLAVDADHLSVERLYRGLQATPATNILPLVIQLADPSPGLGWRGKERRTLEDRGRPDLVLALALLHHLVLSSNVPLELVVEWLWSLGSEVVVEWVEREDPMAALLLAGRPDAVDYRRDHFEQLLARRFATHARVVLPSGTRVLYHLEPSRP